VTPNGWRLAALLAATLGFAVATGWELLVSLAYLFAGALLLGRLWSRLALASVDLRRLPAAERLRVGEELVERLEVRNRGPLPLLPLELHDWSTLPGRARLHLVLVPPFGRRAWETRTRCRRRGEYRLGPVELVAGDPFDAFRARRRLAGGGRLLVLPAVEPLPSLVPLARDLPDGSAQRAHPIGLNDAAQSSTVRDYAPGDPLSRIHWPSTARAGRLIVRQLEREPTADILIALDMDADAQHGFGEDSTEEAAVAAAASLAGHFLAAGRAVGLVAHGAPAIDLPPARGPAQLERLLEALATVRAVGACPFADLLRQIDDAEAWPARVLVAVTSSLDLSWPDALAEVAADRALAVLVEPSTFGGRESSLVAISQLAGGGVPTALVKRGRPLAESFAG
jgi:uncharacterized protein (DUF58 family)